MSRERLWLGIGVLLPALAATIAPMSTVDLAYQVRAGDLMLGSTAILRADPFTFTAMGEPWLYQQWGAGILLAAGFAPAGWGGLVVLRAVLVAAAVGLTMAAAHRWLAARSAALLALAGFVVGIASVGLRAQLLGIVLFAAVLAILAWRDRHPRLTWLVPVLVLAWSNLHGSFFLGPAAVAVAALEEIVARRPAKRLAAVLVLSLAATAVTLWGPGIWAYALGLATNGEVTALITEWQRTSPLTVTGLLFYLSVVGGAALVVQAWRRYLTPPWPSVAWLLGLALLGAWAERGVAWWAFAAPVALAPVIVSLRAAPASESSGSTEAEAAAARGRREPRLARVLNAAVLAVLGVAVVALQPLLRPGDPLAGPAGLLRDAPAGLAAALRDSAGPSDRAVVPQRWASWFEWAAPGIPVMVDSRVEVVPASAWRDYLAITAGGEAALGTLLGIGASVVVVDAATQPELELALRSPGSRWRLVYEDGDGLIFVPAR